jgi:hypothetical protein
MNENGDIIFDRTNYLDKYNSISPPLSTFYANKDNLLNPLYNYIRSNNSCSASLEIASAGVAGGSLCNIISLEFYDIIRNDEKAFGTVSAEKYNLEYAYKNRAQIDTNGNIIGCDMETISKPLVTSAKIQPFKKSLATVLYAYEVQSASTKYTCSGIGNGMTITNIKHYGKIDSSILTEIKTYLNNGIPMRIDIALTTDITSDNTFYGVFLNQQVRSSNKKFPDIEPKAIISQNSFDRLADEAVQAGHAVTICGYADTTTDGLTGVFKIANSWGALGLNGYAYISYDYFFKPLENGGMVVHILVFQ